MICAICGNQEQNNEYSIKEMLFGFRDEFNYFECSACGCLQIAQIPENIEKYYPNNYYSFAEVQQNSSIIRLLRKIRDKSIVEKRGILGRLISLKYPNKFLEYLAVGGLNWDTKILEVGCGAGHFLYSLKDSGFKNLTGVDPYIESEIKNENFVIWKKTIFELADNLKFGVILFNDSFEHMSDQKIVLEKAQNLLVDGGICVIQMPVKTKEIWNRYSVNWVQIDAPRHFFIHTLRSFELLIENTRLNIYNMIFNSDAFQFWGSELYLRDIPLRMKDQCIFNPETQIFSKQQIAEFKKQANDLNVKKEGDHAIFILKK